MPKGRAGTTERFRELEEICDRMRDVTLPMSDRLRAMAELSIHPDFKALAIEAAEAMARCAAMEARLGQCRSEP